MPDDDQPQEIADCGTRAQPALAARMATQLRLTQIGTLFAVLGCAASLLSMFTFPVVSGQGTGRRWAVGAVVANLLLLAICVFQLVSWLRAMQEWKGERDHDLARRTRISWIAHWVSYAVVLFALWTCIAGSLAAGTDAEAAGLLAFSLLFTVVAQALAAVQYLRVSGPPGTIPAHLRRLNEEIQRRR